MGTLAAFDHLTPPLLHSGRSFIDFEEGSSMSERRLPGLCPLGSHGYGAPVLASTLTVPWYGTPEVPRGKWAYKG